jgi:hypothetical protein
MISENEVINIIKSNHHKYYNFTIFSKLKKKINHLYDRKLIDHYSIILGLSYLKSLNIPDLEKKFKVTLSDITICSIILASKYLQDVTNVKLICEACDISMFIYTKIEIQILTNTDWCIKHIDSNIHNIIMRKKEVDNTYLQ